MSSLEPGQSYSVPNVPGLVLRTGHASSLIIRVDGHAVPAIEGDRHDIALDRRHGLPIDANEEAARMAGAQLQARHIRHTVALAGLQRAVEDHSLAGVDNPYPATGQRANENARRPGRSRFRSMPR